MIQYALGIDIGGSKIEAAIVDEQGRILARERVATPANRSKEKVLAAIGALAPKVRAGFKGEIKAAGVGFPGIVNSAGKVVFGGANLSAFNGMDLKTELAARLKLPVVVDNDAHSFTLAEALLGAGQGAKVVVGVIWGTGIGSGVVMDGKVFHGSHGGEGEIGHLVVDTKISDGPQCACGQRGCLDNLASGSAIVRRYQEQGGTIPDPDPRKIYDSTEPAAQEVMAETISYLARGLAALMEVFDPDIIVLGGGVSQLPESVYERLREAVQKLALPMIAQEVKIARAGLGPAAGVIGAALLALRLNS